MLANWAPGCPASLLSLISLFVALFFGGLRLGPHQPSGQVPHRDAEGAGGVRHPTIVAGEFDALAPAPKEPAGCEVQRVERAHGHRERIERAGQYWGASSSSEMRAITSRAASARARVALRECRRVQSSYSSRRLDTRVSVQTEAGGRRSSANRWARATDVSM